MKQWTGMTEATDETLCVRNEERSVFGELECHFTCTGASFIET